MDCFFENGFIKEVVDYEITLTFQFPIQFIPVFAYKQNDFNSLLESEKKKLIECHDLANKNILLEYFKKRATY
jgi:hypothetical protein